MRILSVIAVFLALAACSEQKEVAAVTVQQGLYENMDCEWKDDPMMGRIDPCLCEADIKVARTGDRKLDDVLAGAVEPHFCVGELRKGETTDKLINLHSAEFEVTRDDGRLLSVVYTFHEMPAGAAHGKSWQRAMIYDRQADRWLEQNEIVPPEKQQQVSSAILFRLLELNRTRYDGALKLEGITTDTLLTGFGCHECTLYPLQDGWVVVFNHYAVGPYSVGMVPVHLPESEIGY